MGSITSPGSGLRAMACLLAAAFAAGAPAILHAQAAAEPPAADAADATGSSFQVISSGWTSRCNATSRDAGLSCELEIRIGLQGDGRQITRLSIQQGPDPAVQSGILLQLPLGLFNPAGVTLAIDEGEPLALEVQTCDEAGCYAGTPLTPELEAAMRQGEGATVTFQDLSRNDIGVPIVLDGFGATLDAIR